MRQRGSLRGSGTDQRVKPGADGVGALCAHTARLYITSMTVEDIEKAVARLPEDELSRFRAWFEQFDAARFDQKIERHAQEGRLDRLADEAIDDFRKGRAREL
jgi:hypothetical protein